MRWIKYTLLVFFGLVLLISVLLTFSPGEKWVGSMLERSLTDQLGTRVEIERFETNLFSRVQVWGLVAHGTQSEFVNLAYARLEYNLLEIILNWQSFDLLAVEGLTVHIARDSSGSLDLPSQQSLDEEENTGSAEPLNLALGRVTFEDVLVSYADEVIPIAGTLHDLSFDLNPRGAESYSYHLQADSARLNYEDHRLVSDLIFMNGTLNSDELTIDSAKVAIPGIQASGKAKIRLDQDPLPVTGDIRLAANLRELFVNHGDWVAYDLAHVDGMMDIELRIRGLMPEPEVAMTVDFDAVSINDWPAWDGKVRGNWQGERLDLDELQVLLLDGRLQGNGHIVLDSLFSHEFDLTVERLRLGPLLTWIYGEAIPFEGLADGRLVTKGPIRAPDLIETSSNLNLRKLTYRRAAVPDLALTANYRDGIADLDLRQGDSKMVLDVRIYEEDLKGDFVIDLHHFEDLAGMLNMPSLSGRVLAQGKISGTKTSPSIMAGFSAEKVLYLDFPLDSLSGNLTFRDGHLTFGESRFQGQLDQLDTLQTLFNISGLTGGIVYSGTFSGSQDNPAAQLSARLISPQYDEIGFDGAELDVKIADQNIILNHLLVVKDTLAAQITGSYGIDRMDGRFELRFGNHPGAERPQEGELKDLLDGLALKPRDQNLILTHFALDSVVWKIGMRGQALNLSDVVPLFSNASGFGGQLSYDLDFLGTLDDPGARLRFKVRSPHYEGVALDSISGALSLRDARLLYEPVAFYKDGFRSWVKGHVDLVRGDDGKYSLDSTSPIKGEAEGKNIDLRLLGSFLEFNSVSSGVANYDFSWQGSVGQPQVRGSVEISNGSLKLEETTAPIQDLFLQAVLRDTLVEIRSVTGRVARVPFSMRGTIASRDWLTYRTEFQMGLASPDAFSGSGRLSADSLTFSVEARDFDMAVLGGFIPNLPGLGGTLNTKLKVAGAFAQPSLDGQIQIDRLAFLMPELNTSVSNGVLKARIDQSGLSLDAFSLDVGGGTMTASGYLKVASGEVGEANLQLAMNAIALEKAREYRLKLDSANMTLKNDGANYLLDGDVILGESFLDYNVRPQDILALAREVEQPLRPQGEFIDQLRINLRIRKTNDLWIKNNLARIRLHSEIALVGKTSDLNVLGRIEVVEGYLMYLDRKFTINRGILDFVDPNRLNPLIDITAEATIKSYQSLAQTPYKITLKISGLMEEAIVELTSEPALEKPDIIALLTIGATRQQLTGNNGEQSGANFGQVVKDRLLVFSNQKVSGYTSRTLGNLLGLEKMTIEGDLFGRSGASGPQLLASKKISERMAITYSTTVGHTNEQNIRLDYRLSRFFSLEGQTNQRGQPGMDLKFGLRFK